MSPRETARFRATSGTAEGFGRTPQEALNALMPQVSSDDTMPITIWPFNHGDRFFTDDQQSRLLELKGRRSSLTIAELAELESLVEASFDAAVSRTHALPPVKS